MAYQRGDIVRADAPFSSSSSWRPWLIISNTTHPFNGTEYVAVLVTTSARPEAIELEGQHFTAGGLPQQSYVNPWNPISLKDAAIHRRQATVVATLAEQASQALREYTKSL